MTATNHYKKDEGSEKLRRNITQQGSLLSYKNTLGPPKIRCIFFKWSPTSMAPNFFTILEKMDKNGSLKLTQRIHVDYKKHFSWKNVGANFMKTDIEAHFIVVWEQFV